MKIANTLIAGTMLSTVMLSMPSSAVDVPSGAYDLDPTHASLTWKVKHFGLSNYTARFTKFDVDLQLDAENIESSRVSAVIDASSVRTDYPGDTDFDREITHDSNFLNAAEFPEITFTSTKVERTGDNTARITGDMSMLGVTRSVTLEATLNGTLASHPYAKVPAVGFSAEVTIKRSVFGFGHLIPYVGDDVSFVIEAEFLKAK